MDIPYAELWFLELSPWSCGGRFPFCFLPATKPEIARGYCEQWNMPTHGLTVSEVGEVLLRLHQFGEITFARHDEVDLDLDPTPFNPQSAQQLSSLLYDEFIARWSWNRRRRKGELQPNEGLPRPSHSYSVTAQGIDRWEAYAKPDWSRYRSPIEGRRYEPGPAMWSVSVLTEAFAREILEVESIQFNHLAVINWESAAIEVLIPWQPFGGKTSPEGVKLSVHVTELDSQSFQRENLWQVAELSRIEMERFHALCRPWYENSVKNHPDRPQPRPAE